MGKKARLFRRILLILLFLIVLLLLAGTAAGLIVIGLKNHGLWMTVSNLAALGFATALLAGLLLLGTRAERLLRRRGIAIITRLTGLFLSAIAAGMILDGVKSFFHL